MGRAKPPARASRPITSAAPKTARWSSSTCGGRCSMTKGDVVAVEQRSATKEEAALVEWFDKQKAGQVETLEAAARQIIQLVSALFGLLFGVLSLGRDKLEASLTSPLVITRSIVAV